MIYSTRKYILYTAIKCMVRESVIKTLYRLLTREPPFCVCHFNTKIIMYSISNSDYLKYDFISNKTFI